MEQYVLITDVWGYNGEMAFIPLDDFEKFFTIEGKHSEYAVLNKTLFGGPYNSADTYMQENMFLHARSGLYYGKCEMNLVAIYKWTSN